MKRAVLSAIQLVLLLSAFAAFFALTPWLGCEPIDEMSSEQQANAPVPPADAVCFTINHGEIAFHRHGLISEEPGRFALHLAAFVLPLSFVIASVLKRRRSSP